MINNSHYMVLDTETTGLFPEKNAVIEIAFIILNNKLEEVDRYSAINKIYNNIDTGKPMEVQQQALDIHGISMKEIDNGITIQESIYNMDKIMSKYAKGKDKIIMVNHNSDFDIPMMQYAYRVANKDYFKYIGKTHFCTLKMSHAAWGHDDSMSNFKLPTCCERIGVSIGDSHRGFPDVQSTVELFKYHVGNMRGGDYRNTVISHEPLNTYGRSHSFKF